jgi:hypothetical protein
MANTKLTALTALTGANAKGNDVLYVGDVSAGTSGSKKMTVAQFREADRLTREKYTLYVNDFYPPEVTASRDGATHPLSDFYATLAEAEAAFPYLDFTEWSVALTDEVDWCAWQSAADYTYTQDPDLNFSSTNLTFGCWHIKASGDYRVNKSIVFTCYAVRIEGEGPPQARPFGGATSITYSGAGGTDTAKVAIFDFYGTNEGEGAFPGRYPINSAGGRYEVHYMGFFGRGEAGATITKANSPSTSGVGFTLGIRARNCSFLDITHCAFGGSLMDAIWIASALFARVSFCYFYDIYRDSVVVLASRKTDGGNDFSTTVWIDDNEFGYYGRYAILQDYNGAVEPSPSIRRNSIEGPSDVHYYHTHLEEWVQGVRSSVCQVGGTYGLYSENRCETTLIPSENMWADLHLVGCGSLTVRDNRFGNIILSAKRNTTPITTAYDTFRTTYYHVDINAERNWHAPVLAGSDYTDQITNCIFDGNIKNLVIDVIGKSVGPGNYFANGSFTVVAPTTTSGTYIYQVTPPGSGSPSLGYLDTAMLVNVTDNSNINGPCSIGSLNLSTGCGDYKTITSTWFGTWAAATAYYAGVNATNDVFPEVSQKKWVYPTVWNGCVYECTVSGTSHASTEPTWPTTIDATVTDNTVTWKCVRVALPKLDASFPNTVLVNSVRHIKRNSPPTSGYHGYGTVCWARVPDLANGVPVGWVCVADGTPGTWAPIGNDYGYVPLASLPAASSGLSGCRAVVSDSNATLSAGLGNTVASGGSNKVPVYCDGSAWKIG